MLKQYGHHSLFKRGKIWYYYTYDKYGKRCKYSTGCRSKAKAEDEVMRRVQDNALTIGEYVRPQSHLFRDYAADWWNFETCPYIQDKLNRGGTFSKTSASGYNNAIETRMMPTFGDMAIEDITSVMVRKWHQELPKKYGIANKTANTTLLAFKIILEQAVQDGIIDRNPCDSVKQLFHKAEVRGCFNQIQVTSLFNSSWPSPAAELACFIASKTGMRLGEILALHESQLCCDLNINGDKQYYIRVNASFSLSEGRKSTKSGRERIVPISEELYNRIRNFKAEGDYIISTTNGKKPCSNTYIEDELDKQMEGLKIDHKELNLTFHSFRHYVNTRLVASGMPEAQIRSIIGHESKEMTDHYLHLTANDVSQMLNVVG